MDKNHLHRIIQSANFLIVCLALVIFALIFQTNQKQFYPENQDTISCFTTNDDPLCEGQSFIIEDKSNPSEKTLRITNPYKTSNKHMASSAKNTGYEKTLVLQPAITIHQTDLPPPAHIVG